jgi:hypothetical protein
MFLILGHQTKILPTDIVISLGIPDPKNVERADYQNMELLNKN